MGSRLRERREHADLTLGQVAEYEQIGRQYLSKLELGVNEPPTWPLLAQLARRYNTSADYLLGLSDDPSPRRDEPLPEPVRELLQLSVELPASRQEELLELAHVLYEAEQRANVREYRRLRALVLRLPDGQQLAEVIDDALRLAESGDLDGAWALVDAYLADRPPGDALDDRSEDVEL